MDDMAVKNLLDLCFYLRGVYKDLDKRSHSLDMIYTALYMLLTQPKLSSAEKMAKVAETISPYYMSVCSLPELQVIFKILLSPADKVPYLTEYYSDFKECLLRISSPDRTDNPVYAFTLARFPELDLLCELLLSRLKVLATYRYTQNMTLAHIAIAHKNDRGLAALRIHGSDFTAVDCFGNSLLHCAALAQNAQCIPYLLINCRSLLNLANNDGNTALHIAASQGNFETCRVLLSFTPDTSIVNRAGLSADQALKDAFKERYTSLAQTALYRPRLRGDHAVAHVFNPAVTDEPSACCAVG